MSGPSSPRDIHETTTDSTQTLIDWIHQNAFPSIELHRKILRKAKHNILSIFEKFETKIRTSSPSDKDINMYLVNGVIDIHTIKYTKDNTLSNIIKFLDSGDISLIMLIASYVHWDQGISVDPIDDIIHQEYFNHGYYFHYFGWLNIKFPPVMAKWSGDHPFFDVVDDFWEPYILKLTPETFELGLPQLTIATYNKMIKLISKGYIHDTKYENGKKLLSYTEAYDVESNKKLININRYIGWSRSALMYVIENAGLIDPHINGVPKSVIKPELKGILPGLYIEHPYYYYYYATIYRKIFKTVMNFDWETICRNKLQKYDLLKFIAVNDFGLDYKRVRSLKYNQLCSVLTEESERKRQIRLELGEQVKRIIEPILYQPGSFLVPEPSGFAVKEEPKYIRPEWQELYNVCSNPDAVSKDELAFIARRMGVRKSLPKDLTNLTNNQICSTLINYVNLLQESKKHI